MKMWVWYAAVLPVWLVYGEVNHHAPAHKVLQQKLPCKSDVFLKGKFILQGNVKAVCKLGVLSTLGFFHGIPQGLTVCKFRGSMGRQENVGADHAALSGVVAVLAVILAIQSLPGSVGGRSDSGLSCASLSLRDAQMK